MYIYIYIYVCVCVCVFTLLRLSGSYSARRPKKHAASTLARRYRALILRGEYAERRKKYDIIFRFSL